MEGRFWREPFTGGFAAAFTVPRFGVPAEDCLVWSEVPIPANGIYPESSLVRMTRAEATALMDEMLAAGIRPSGESPTEVAAISRHLADMRALVFGRYPSGHPNPQEKA